METLLVTLLTFYPSIFIYASIPEEWMRGVGGIIPTGAGFFLVHLILFSFIFFVVYMVLRKFISVSYFGTARRGFLGKGLMLVFVFALALIAFYYILPGNIIYDSPEVLDQYLLRNPYTLLALVAPFLFLFFD